MNMTVQPQDTTTVSIQYEVQAIALSHLALSTANVRRVNSTVGVSELADSIKAVGLLSPCAKARKANMRWWRVPAVWPRCACWRKKAAWQRMWKFPGMCGTPIIIPNCHWPKTYSGRP